MKNLILLITLLFATSAWGNAKAENWTDYLETNLLQPGSYEGYQSEKKRKKVQLIIKTVPGRVGSFYALLIRKNKSAMSLYLLDTLNGRSSYTMTPLQVTNDGEVIGITNDDPSLVLSVSPKPRSSSRKKKKDETERPLLMTITSAQSSNTSGFTGPFTFNGKLSSARWVKPVSAWYDRRGMDKALHLGPLDPDEREAIVSSTDPALNGTYTLAEKQKDMYLLKGNSVLATGREVQEQPRAIVVFYKEWKSRSTKMILVNPDNSEDLKTYWCD